MPLRAKFITFEGGEGSGKTTQSRMLYQYFVAQNIPVVLTREVGGCPQAEKIRECFLNLDLDPMSELMLVIAARYEHVLTVVLPALKKGQWVICDRFVDSTACYQGGFIENGQDLVYQLHDQLIGPLFNKVQRSPLPDITFFMDIPPEKGLKRAAMRINNNKFEDKILLFHETIYKEFTSLIERFKNRIVPIKNKELTPLEIHELIKLSLFEKFA